MFFLSFFLSFLIYFVNQKFHRRSTSIDIYAKATEPHSNNFLAKEKKQIQKQHIMISCQIFGILSINYQYKLYAHVQLFQPNLQSCLQVSFNTDQDFHFLKINTAGFNMPVEMRKSSILFCCLLFLRKLLDTQRIFTFVMPILTL